MKIKKPIEELLFLAITRAKIQLRKTKQKKRSENPLRFPPNFPIYYWGHEKYSRSKEIHGVAIFKNDLIRHLIYLIADNDFWQDYSVGYSHRKNLTSTDQNFDLKYLFDEKIDIPYTDGSYAERSIIIRTICMLCGENPYGSGILNNNSDESSELFKKANKILSSKIFFEIRKLKSNFINVKNLMGYELSMNIQRWDGRFTNLQLHYSIDNIIEILDEVEKTLFGMFKLWDAMSAGLYEDELMSEQKFIEEREKLDTYRWSKELSWSEYDPVNIAELVYLCPNYAIELEFVVDIWGGSLKAFFAEQNKNKKEGKETIKVFKALNSKEINQIAKAFFEKGYKKDEVISEINRFKCVESDLVTISSAITFLESKKVNYKLDYKDRKQDFSYKYIQYLEENYLSEEKIKKPYPSINDARNVVMFKRGLIQILCN